MRRTLLAAVLCLLAVNAAGQVDARGFVAFEAYDFDAFSTRGFRQNLDLGIVRPLTSTMSLRLQLRAEDYRGTNSFVAGSQDMGRLELQPGAQFALNAETLRASINTDYFSTRYTRDDIRSRTAIDRTGGQITWTPAPRFSVGINGQRLSSTDDQFDRDVTEQWAMGRASWSWKALQVAATERYAQSQDGFLDRTSLSHIASLDYSQSLFSDRLGVSAMASADFADITERVIEGANEVAVPILVSRALFAVDDTPSDGRDHPPVPYPGLTDGLLETSTGIELGPNGVSFQNIVVDAGRYQTIDEFRVHVRDEAGNPLRVGGGPVTWDVWTSTDGLVWTTVTGVSTSFNRTLSRYEIRFDETLARWFKVVNFGVNSSVTNVTEIQAYHHEIVETREPRNGADRNVSGFASIYLRPVRRLLFSYSGSYAGNERDYDGEESLSSSLVQHGASIEYEVVRNLLARAEYGSTQNDSGRGAIGEDSSTTYRGVLQYNVTSRLRFSGEGARTKQILLSEDVDTDLVRLRVDAVVFPTLSFTGGVGREQQSTRLDDPATRMFADFGVNARLTRTLRLSVLGTLQQVDSSGGDFVQLLGARRDNRISADVTWKPGDQLLLSGRVGWVSGGAMSGFTHRIRGEWYPFPGGSVLLGGTYDQDIDPMTDRKATRLIINPRWLMNRWMSLDINYTSLTNRTAALSLRQRTLLATLLLTR